MSECKAEDSQNSLILMVGWHCIESLDLCDLTFATILCIAAIEIADEDDTNDGCNLLREGQLNSDVTGQVMLCKYMQIKLILTCFKCIKPVNF